jgi:hypothetical protein
MAQKNTNKKQVSNSNKDRKGDTGRTSNQGQKVSSGGSPDTNNKGNRKGV